MPKRKAKNENQVSIGIGDIRKVSGEVNIAGGDIYKGYTAEQVSVLLTQITSTFQPKPFDGRCPYKGLDVFEEEDADLFFGRETLVADLVGRVKESRAVFIIGPSGSGKSSLVRAGLIHALKQGAIKSLHSDRWLYETIKPGRDPMEALALAFSRLKSPELANYFRQRVAETNILHECAESVLSGSKDQRFVLFLDQFEEVFTQISKEEERVAFLNLLSHAALVENGRVIVLFAMRSDFVSNCAMYPQLNSLFNQQSIQIGAPQPNELVSAIAQPALRVGLRIDPDLVAQIINDMHGEPGALPLMQFALKDLFDSRQEQGGLMALTLEEYLHHGGIRKSLERHADASFAKLDKHEQDLARSIFSGLIEIGRGTQDTSRTALFNELVPANAKTTDVENVLQKMADARLVTIDEQAGKETVTLSHEKLIDAWPWLKKLVNENRDIIALQNEIASDAKEWEDHKRDTSYLYTGARLASAHEQVESKNLTLSDSSYEFVKAGQAQQRRSQTTRIIGLSVPIGLVILAVIIFSYISTTNSSNLAKQNEAFANTQAAAASTSQANAKEAQKQAKIARAGELASQSIEIHDENFQVSLLLGIEAFRSWDTVRSHQTLLEGTRANPQLIQYLSHRNLVNSVIFSPDGKTLASDSVDGTIILWDVETGQPIGQPLTGHTGFGESIAFSPDGKILASGGDENIIMWDVETRQPIGQLLTGHAGFGVSIAFSPDGKILASGGDENIILWDVETRQPIGQPITGYTSVAFSPDGKILALGKHNNIILWDVETRQSISQPITGYTYLGDSVVFSPDGRTLVLGEHDNIILWDVETRQPIGQPLPGHISGVSSVAFSPDGKILASSSSDGTIILWDVETRQRIGQPLTGHISGVSSVAFSPDGKILASAGDYNIILWKIDTHQPLSEVLTADAGTVFGVAFSPDGRILASGNSDGAIILWDMETRQPIGQPLTGHTSSVYSLAFSPHGRILASGSLDNTIILWDVETHQPISEPLTGHLNWVSTVAFSPDGKILATGGDDNIILWDVETRQPIGQPLAGNIDPVFSSVSSVAFSPDGRILASGGDESIILWDVETRQPIGQPLTGHISGVSSVAFSPDGSILASGSRDGTIILWDVETGQPLSRPLSGHGDSVYSIAYSPDGKILASGSGDNTIMLWDVEIRQPIGQPFTRHTGFVYSIAFSPDGKTLASGSDDETIILWNVNPEYWIEQSCQRAGRNFTRAEWEGYFLNETYRKTCDQWPLEIEAITTP